MPSGDGRFSGDCGRASIGSGSGSSASGSSGGVGARSGGGGGGALPWPQVVVVGAHWGSATHILRMGDGI